MITVKHLAGDEWLVTVEAKESTQHRVRVTAADLARYAPGHSAEELLKESFQFLLGHEPNTSILSSFDLPVISRYFPDFEQEIKKRLRI
jgi:hypothetical protein